MSSIETTVGSIKGIPSEILGWVFIAGICGFLVYVQTQTHVGKLNEIIKGQQLQIQAQQEQIQAMERLTAKIEYFERVRLDLGTR